MLETGFASLFVLIVHVIYPSCARCMPIVDADDAEIIAEAVFCLWSYRFGSMFLF